MNSRIATEDAVHFPGNAGLRTCGGSGGASTEPRVPREGPRGWHSRGYLPHFDSNDVIQHVTFHLGDSLPKETVQQLLEEIQQLDPDQRDIEKRRRLEALVDAGHGACWLQRTDCARIIQETLLHFDGERYRMIAWVVMPNHVHTLFQTLQGWSMDAVVGSWKTFTANAIGRIVRQPGAPIPHVWHSEFWDRFIRDENHFSSALAYIHNNPVKAGLVSHPEDWPWSRAGNERLRTPGSSSLASAEPRVPGVLTVPDVEGTYTIPMIRSDVAGDAGPGTGAVLAALGDSITEGYWGERFWRDDLDLRADRFPPESVSSDGRNFPQFAPTSKRHSPDANCFTSWMPRLNDLLSERWGRQVFIANEGWGGITTGGYLERMRTDTNWQERMRLLRPGIWLIHLGVNDERQKIPTAQFAANLEGIVDTLVTTYAAAPASIVVATPCYDFFPGALDILTAYVQEITRVIAERGLRTGPDFFDAYAHDRARYYGEDPVHPNVEGMRLMAELWAERIEGLRTHSGTDGNLPHRTGGDGLPYMKNRMNSVFNVRDMDATGDGDTLDTGAIQRAIDVCAEAGGGTVLFPAGNYNSGTLYLKSNITLHLESGAILLLNNVDCAASVIRAGKRSKISQGAGIGVLLLGQKVRNVSIVGAGVIDATLCGQRDNYRGPVGLFFEESENILIQDVTVRNTPNWAITFFVCKHIRLIGCSILDSSYDGIALSCCQHVLIDGVLIENPGDDPIVFANCGYPMVVNTSDPAWITTSTPSFESPAPGVVLTDDVVIRNTTIRTNTSRPKPKGGGGWHAAVVFHFPWGIMRNLTISHCTFEGRWAIFQIMRRKTPYKEIPASLLENIAFSHITAANISRIVDWQALCDVEESVIRHVSLEDVSIDGLGEQSVMHGLPLAPIENISFSNIKVRNVNSKLRSLLQARYVRGLHLHDVEIEGAETLSLLYANGTDLVLDNVDCGGGIDLGLDQVQGAVVRNTRPSAVNIRLHVKGAESENIRIEADDSKDMMVDVSGEIRKGAIAPAAREVECLSLSVSREINANETFTANATFVNKGESGAFKAEVCVDGKVAGAKWMWLKKGETRQETLVTSTFHAPGERTVTVGSLAAAATVRPTPAAFAFGDRMKVSSPAAAGELTSVTVSLKNTGGETGTEEVALSANGKAVVSRKVVLGPGEETEVTLDHRFADEGPRTLRIGDFPAWPYATYANTKAAFHQTRQGKIIIEAGGLPKHIRSPWLYPSLCDAPDREYAAVYVKGVAGDFVATVQRLRQDVRTMWSGTGLLVKNDMTKPGDSSGFVDLWDLNYMPDAGEWPCVYKMTKQGNTFRRLKGEGNYPSQECPSAGLTQDIGLFACANNSNNESIRAEFQDFAITKPAPVPVP